MLISLLLKLPVDEDHAFRQFLREPGEPHVFLNDVGQTDLDALSRGSLLGVQNRGVILQIIVNILKTILVQIYSRMLANIDNILGFGTCEECY